MPHASDSSSLSFTIQIPLLIRFRSIILFSFVSSLPILPLLPSHLPKEEAEASEKKKRDRKKEAGAVKVIDKERDGSEMVIARGKKRTPGRKTGRGRRFYISQRCCIRSERAVGRKKDKGRKKKQKKRG